MKVKSSNIGSIDYDPQENLLHITFNSGRTYQYYNVPADIHEKLLSAPSIGGYFNDHIKNRYHYREE